MISTFKGENDFLSNFYKCNILHEGYVYRSVENAYQALKAFDPDPIILNDIRFEFTRITPREAKQLGKKIRIREDWDTVKLGVMYTLLMTKFSIPTLTEKLLNTGDHYLQEGNWWGDRFWGVCNDEGMNHLGRLLMTVRDLKRMEY